MVSSTRSVALSILVFSLLVTGCGGGSSHRKSRGTDDKVGANNAESLAIQRVNPGFLQQLERKSMLFESVEKARIVSGSEIAWKSSASVGSHDELMAYADTWLFVHPLTLLGDTRRTAFAQLNSSSMKAVLREIGAKGIYIAPIGGSGLLWAHEDRGFDTGEDIVQFSFSAAAGKESDYKRLMGSLLEVNGLMGSDLVPAATGLGPDFFLAARQVRDFPGIYCMVDVPQDLWKLLPECKAEFDVAALSQDQVAALSQQQLLPLAMRDEHSPFLRKAGWAATGEVRGVDGNKRRWVYRYYQSPYFAVLNWDDPSQAAHRILSGSAVQQIGMLGQTLIGLRFEAFQGLEPARMGSDAGASFSVEPALTASQALSRQIRKYGGFSWLRDDDLTLPAVNDFLRTGTDFVFDSAFSPAAEHALVTGDATLLNFMADEVLRLQVDTRRLVHSMPAQDGINYTLPHLSYLIAQQNNEQAKALKATVLAQIASQPLYKDGFLYTTGAGLANLAAGDKLAAVTKAHALLVFFKAMQPGVLMISGQDVSGAMPLASGKVEEASRGAYALTSEAASLVVTNAGIPKADMIYLPADAQVHEKSSFIKTIGQYVAQRNAVGLAKGTLIAHPQTKNLGVIALVTRLEGDSYVVTVCNFGKNAVSETISLQGIAASALGRSKVLAGGSGGYSFGGSTLTVQLAPLQGRAFILGKASGSVKADSAGKKEEKNDENEAVISSSQQEVPATVVSTTDTTPVAPSASEPTPANAPSRVAAPVASTPAESEGVTPAKSTPATPVPTAPVVPAQAPVAPAQAPVAPVPAPAAPAQAPVAPAPAPAAPAQAPVAAPVDSAPIPASE